MDWLIASAHAQSGGAAGEPSFFGGLLPIIILFAIFYLLLIRPQMKRQKEHKNMVGGLEKGDEVVTNGGLLGKIEEVGDSFISLKINEQSVVKIQRNAISGVMPKGTIKSS